MAEQTTPVNNLADTVKAAIGDMTAGQLMGLLITLPEVIAQRAYDIQCSESVSNAERADAAYAKMIARDATDTAESDVRRWEG